MPAGADTPVRTRLVSVSLRGFRSISNTQELLVEPDLTVLAGRNNVGKTAFLHALTLPTMERPGWDQAAFNMDMRWTIPGDELRSALQAQAWSTPGVTERFRTDATFELGCTIQPLQNPQALTPAGQAVPGDSHIIVEGRPFPFQVSSVRIGEGFLRFERKRRSPTEQFGTFTWADGTDPALYAVPNLPQWAFMFCVKLFTSVFYLGPRRTGSPRVPLQSADALSSDGANLTNLLADLYINRRRTIYPLVEEFIRQAFPEILHVDIHVTQQAVPTAEAFVVYPGSADEGIPLEHCGTGVEQLLMLGAAILSTGTPRVFLIDEPHAFLHPHAERSLLKLMRAHPEHQYIVATHSSIFLRAAQLARIRLLKRDQGHTVVNTFSQEAEIFAEIGLTADDVWSSEAILWVEGPTEVGLYEVLGDEDPRLLEDIRVKAMPDYMRAARSKPKEMERITALIRAVSDALSPFGVRVRFLFDPDELNEERKRAVVDRSGGTVTFQPFREVENLLLYTPSLTVVINARRSVSDLPPVSEEAVSRRLDDLLTRVGNRDLYPSASDVPNRVTVRGSRLLHALFMEFDGLEYEKVRDGRAIAVEILSAAPEILAPLRGAATALRPE